MIRRGLIAGNPRDWASALNVVDRGKRKLPRREMNNLLDTLALSIDAEREAKAAAERLPTRRPMRRLGP
jgi:hypothetical protein